MKLIRDTLIGRLEESALGSHPLIGNTHCMASTELVTCDFDQANMDM